MKQKNLHVVNHHSVYISQFRDFLKKVQLSSKNEFFELEPGFKLKNLTTLKKEMKEYDKIILHGLDYRLVVVFFFNKRFLKKTHWITWGGDVYYRQYMKRDFWHLLFEFMRGQVIKNVAQINSLCYGMYEISREKYRTKANHQKVFYPVKKTASEMPIKSPLSVKNILVGNSGDPSNNHLEIFDWLMEYSGNDFRIYCPLNYGKKPYINEIMALGKERFGTRFIPILKPIPFDRYVKLLSTMDVGIFNHQRMQAMGNIRLLLNMKKKIFIREDIFTWGFFINLGVNVFSVSEIKRMDFSEFIHFDPAIGGRNEEIIKREFSDEYCARLWKAVLDE